MGKHVVPGWLHFPLVGEPPYPVVVMLPGMDTFKEKLVWSYGDKMLERGFAALAIDGPGQSEALMRGLLVTADNFADAGRACLAWIDTRGDLDQDRIGVFGRSFGSYAATVFSNAIADRLRGVVVGLPCFEPGFNRIFEEASPTYKNRFMFMAGYEDEAEFDRFIAGFDLRTRVSSLRCPLMVLGGELDELAPIKHVFEVCKKVPGPVDIVVYQNERHAPWAAAVVAAGAALVRNDGGLAGGARSRPCFAGRLAISLHHCVREGRATSDALTPRSGFQLDAISGSCKTREVSR